MGLDLNNFRTVIDDNFATDTSLNRTLWSDNWGYSDQYTFGGGALTLTGRANQYWYPVGFKQATPSKSAGEGYGLYQFSGYANAGQGHGISFIMWRADNTFLDASTPDKATEIDVLESWDGTRTGESTLHWYDSGAKNDNGYNSHQINVDPTRLHTYSVDWERGSLTFYVDGQQIYQDTVHAPLDYADGGSNEVMGAQVIYGTSQNGINTVQLHITDIRYSAPVAPGTPPPATISLSAPGTVQEASAGAGVTITERITATNLGGVVYEEVLTAAGAVESAYQAITLVGGAASSTVHLAHSGDVIRVVDAVASPTVTATSTPVTITDLVAPAQAAVSVARPAALAVGSDLFTGIVTNGSPGTVRFAWHASATGETASNHDMVLATRQADGSFAASVTVDHPGQTGYFYVAVDGVVTDEWNAVPLATPPATPPGTPTISLSAPGTVQEASAGAGVTITERITAANLGGTVYEEVLTAAGAVESAYQAITLVGGAASSTVHLAHSGDVIRVVDAVASPTVTATSTPVTITDLVAPAQAAVSVARPAALAVGSDLFTGIVTNGSPGTVRFAWHASATGETASNHDMVLATRQADGSFAASVTVDHPGQTGYFYVAVDGVLTDEWNAVPLASAGAAAAPSFKVAVSSVQGSVPRDIVASAAGQVSAYPPVPPAPSHAGAASSLLAGLAAHPTTMILAGHSQPPHA